MWSYKNELILLVFLNGSEDWKFGIAVGSWLSFFIINYNPIYFKSTSSAFKKNNVIENFWGHYVSTDH